MASDDLEIKIDNSQAIKAIDETNKSLSKFGATSSKSFDSLSKSSKKAGEDVSKSSSKMASGFSSVGSALKTMGALAVGAAGFLAVKKLVGGMGDAIDAASKQENAMNSLVTALKLSGEATKANVSDLTNFANALQDTAGIGDETTLQMLALAKSFGASSEQAKTVVTAASELSAATGKSLEESVRQVSKTLGGFAGELGEVNPKIKELTKEELMAGKAAEVLINQFGGTAAAKLQTFSGQLEATKGRFGDMLEPIGELITKNPVVIKLINAMGEGFKAITKVLADNSEAIRIFINKGIVILIKALGLLTYPIQLVVKIFGTLIEVVTLIPSIVLKAVRAMLSFEFVEQVVRSLIRAFLGLSQTIVDFLAWAVKLPESFLKLAGIDLSGVTAGLQGIKDRLNQTDQTVKSMSISEKFNEFQKTVDNFKGDVKAGVEFSDESLSNARTRINKFADELGKLKPTVDVGIKGGGVLKDGKLEVNVVQSVPKELEGKISQVDIIQNILDSLSSLLPVTIASAVAEFFKDFGKNLLPNVVKGSEGAINSVSSAFAALSKDLVKGLLTKPGMGDKQLAEIDAMAGVVGGVVGGLAVELANGPEHVKAMVEEFATALPDIIENIAAALPALIIALADRADEIIIAIVRALPLVIGALIQATPKIAIAIAKSVVDFLRAGLEGLLYNFEKFGEFFDKAASDIKAGAEEAGAKISGGAKEIGSKISESFKLVTDKIKEELTSAAKFLTEPLQRVVTQLAEFPAALINGFVDLSGKIAEAGSIFIKKIIEAAQKFIEKIGEKVGGGTRNILEKGKGYISDRFKLASGGTIPPGFNNDTFSAFLSSGELVVPRNDVTRLQKFLDREESGGAPSTDNAVVIALLGQVVQLLNQPMTVQTEAKVNGKAMADIILNLNRVNARLA